MSEIESAAADGQPETPAKPVNPDLRWYVVHG